jgi:murein DD-endopeptidase MepM/ murein hydrolase activator NlpD
MRLLDFGKDCGKALAGFLVVIFLLGAQERPTVKSGPSRPVRPPRPGVFQVDPRMVRLVPNLKPVSRPRRYVNLSEIQLRPNRRVRILEDQPPRQLRGTIRPADRPRVPVRSVPRWDSVEGRRTLGNRLRAGRVADRTLIPGLRRKRPHAVQTLKAEWQGGFICTEPTLTKADESGCCSYAWPQQNTSGDVTYRQPLHAFGDEATARQFAETVRASMPFFLPYQDPDVFPGQGWLYDSGALHVGLDYSRAVSDPASNADRSFEVRAVGDGEVVAVFWDSWMGNMVILEHQAANGDRYRSLYAHLRNGFTHDLEKAKAIQVVADSPPQVVKYSKYAHKDNPSALQWGTDSQTIPVKPGDKVFAGQAIAWSGNTGPGGAAAGLSDDGDPFDPKAANNHLHMMMAAPDPAQGSADWVLIDPYGVYGQMNAADGSRCYELGEKTAYARLFAPFYSSFHNVPLDYVLDYWGYYTGMGMALQTISVHLFNGQVLSSGSFQGGLSPAWQALVYMTDEELQQADSEMQAQGFRPREIGVTVHTDGVPRFSAIWQPSEGKPSFTFTHLTDAEWDAQWQERFVEKHQRVDDHFIYEAKGIRRHAVVFVDDGDTMGLWENFPSPDFANKFFELDGQGLQITSFNAGETGGGVLYSGIWRSLPASRPMFYDLSPAEYQQNFLDLSALGYRPHKIQGYANSDRFGVIWTKP